MGLKSLTIKHGATNSVAGGSDFVFADDGVTITNGVHLVVPATTDYSVRESATWKFRPPTLLPTGVYTRDKKSVSFTVPMTLASGAVVNNVIRIEREVHPEMTVANVLEFNQKAAQLLWDTDTTAFWATGSLS